MIDQINKLIALNLMILYASEHKIMGLTDFKDEQGKPIPGAKMLAEIMQQKELIKNYTDDEHGYQLTELGEYIAESGGWLIYLERLKKLKSHDTFHQSGKPKSKKLFTELLIAGLIMAVLCILIISCI
ncbi:hypothetical protein [Flavobacterium terrisoli]|uniref:hypothetical protein n=1 Tax=Flavobacterium terrisoli TaxID=3242195 RepID=UPI0025429B79|nr:hypothetical protein [Flavobacterium buctense]